MNKNKRYGLRTWIEIDPKAIKHNLKVFRSLIKPECLIMAVVKSNAYGHDLISFSKIAEKFGVNYLGVDSAVEGMALRHNGIKKPILVLGYTLPEIIKEATQNNLSLSISNLDTLNSLIALKLKRPVRIHLKVDTGMHRQGFSLKEAKELIKKLKAHKKKIIAEGLFTHFAKAKNPSFPSYTLKQIELFNQWRGIFKNNGFEPICHAAASSGTILFSQAHFDMVRVGAGLYGIWPSLETKNYAENKFQLEPVLSWRTILAEVKNLPKGSYIGYDCTETLGRDSTIGICPIGYWHGYPRNLSSIGKVLIKGVKVKVLGRVSMDMLIIDLTGVKNPKIGDEVTLIGRDGKEEISLEEVAILADTSSYEIVDRLNPLIERIYT